MFYIMLSYDKCILIKWLIPLTSVSAAGLVSALCLNRSDSGLVGLFGRDRSDPAAQAKH